MGRRSANIRPDGNAGPRVLEGARVLVTRSPDRAGELVSALRGTGAEPLLLPLIDFEHASDQHSLDVAFDALGAGAYSWLVVSSVTTVQVLRLRRPNAVPRSAPGCPAACRSPPSDPPPAASSKHSTSPWTSPRPGRSPRRGCWTSGRGAGPACCCPKPISPTRGSAGD